MKHILNEMSDEERNSIRSQHTGTLQVQTGKFKKLVENRLGNAKPLISESMDSGCLRGAGFTRESVGGPMTRSMVYEKTHNGVRYQIGITGNDTPKSELKMIKNGKSQYCSWSCDSSSPIGIKHSGCKVEQRPLDEQEDSSSTEDMPLAPMDEDDSDYRMYDLPSIHQDIEDELMEMSDDEGREYLTEIIEFCEDKLNGYPEDDSEEDMMNESDLMRIVKRAISEQLEDEYEGDYTPTLKEKIESVIRNSVTNREEVIQVLEDLLREKKSANSMRDRLRR